MSLQKQLLSSSENPEMFLPSQNPSGSGPSEYDEDPVFSEEVEKEIKAAGENFAFYIKDFAARTRKRSRTIFVSKEESNESIRQAGEGFSFEECKKIVEAIVKFDRANNGNGEIARRIINYDGPMPKFIQDGLREYDPQTVPCIFWVVKHTKRVDIAKLLFLHGAQCENIEFKTESGWMESLGNAAKHDTDMFNLVRDVVVACRMKENLWKQKELIANDTELKKYKIDFDSEEVQ
jgi:hypothetical protein